MNRQFVFFKDVYTMFKYNNPNISYFWITSVKSYNKYKIFNYDRLTTEKLNKIFTSFKGINDIEGHFKFLVSEKETRLYLQSLNMIDGGIAD